MGDLSPYPYYEGRVEELTGAKDVSCHQYHGCAVLVDGSVKCFGRNTYSELLIESVTNVQSVAVADRLSCVLTNENKVFCSGTRLNGQSGWMTGPVIELEVSGSNKIYTGRYDLCAIMPSGTVQCADSDIMDNWDKLLMVLKMRFCPRLKCRNIVTKSKKFVYGWCKYDDTFGNRRVVLCWSWRILWC